MAIETKAEQIAREFATKLVNRMDDHKNLTDMTWGDAREFFKEALTRYGAELEADMREALILLSDSCVVENLHRLGALGATNVRGAIAALSSRLTTKEEKCRIIDTPDGEALIEPFSWDETPTPHSAIGNEETGNAQLVRAEEALRRCHETIDTEGCCHVQDDIDDGCPACLYFHSKSQ